MGCPATAENGRDPVDVSRSSHNPEVAGSNPAPATNVVAGQRPFPIGRGPLACVARDQIRDQIANQPRLSRPTPSQPGSTTEVVHGSGSEHANVLLTWENTASDSRFSSRQKDIHAMRVSHSFPAISATFDDPNLVSCAGLAPTMALAQRAGLTDLVAHTLTLKAVGGVNAHLKVPALVAGMVAGADSIDDMDLLRHGGMGRLFTGVRAPSTLGTFLRSFTFGHVRQL